MRGKEQDRVEQRRPWDEATTALQTATAAERPVSILFADPTQAVRCETAATPPCFGDIDMATVIDSVVAGRNEYRLYPFFLSPLADRDSVTYRQEVFADLEGTGLAEAAMNFAAELRSSRAMLTQAAKTQHRYQIRTWLLRAAGVYVDAVTALMAHLQTAAITSRALVGLRECLAVYVGSPVFQTLAQDLAVAREALAGVRYTLLFYANVIRVRRFEGEADYGAEVSAFFDRFRQADGDHSTQPSGPELRNRMDEQVLDRVVSLFPEAFGALDHFCDEHPSWLDGLLIGFEREVQFYLGWLAVVGRLRTAGLPVCYPEVSDSSKVEAVTSTYDLALAIRNLPEPGSDQSGRRELVTNDYHLAAAERIMVVTGPNQGGKTTFARAFGQLHWLASLGCPVPGAAARLCLADGVFSHFERGEGAEDMRGKLEDDLVRVHEILGQASARSVVILNEIFSTTTIGDATTLSRAILSELSELDCLVVCVTFLDELAGFDDKTVSIVAGVDPSDPTVRTFKLDRRPADGRAYAVVLAERYGLSRKQVRERLAR